jgi:hypothetical protein
MILLFGISQWVAGEETGGTPVCRDRRGRLSSCCLACHHGWQVKKQAGTPVLLLFGVNSAWTEFALAIIGHIAYTSMPCQALPIQPAFLAIIENKISTAALIKIIFLVFFFNFI